MGNNYEIKSILLHYFDANGGLRYRVEWTDWPLSAASSVSAEDLQKTARNALNKYHEQLGINGLENIIDKLKETAKKDFPVERSITVDKIIRHTVDNKGEIVFSTKFSCGGVIDRPRKAFITANEKQIVEKYINEKMIDMKTKSRRTREIKETRVRASTRTRASKAQDKPDSDAAEGTTEETPVRASTRSRAPKPQVNQDSAAVDCGDEASTPSTSRGRKRAAPTSRNVSDKRQKSARPNNDIKKHALSIFKDTNGKECILYNDEKGEVVLEELDIVQEKDPKFVHQSLKKAYFSKKE